MKRQLLALSRYYRAALQKHLQQWPKRGQPPHQLWHRAVSLGLETADVAKLHETALATLMPLVVSVTTRNQLVKRAGTFFAEIAPIRKTALAKVKSSAGSS